MEGYSNGKRPTWKVGVVAKAAIEAKENRATVVMLIPARTDTRWFHAHIYKQHPVTIEFIKGRLKFVAPNKPKGAAPFPSMLVTFKGFF